MCTQPSVPLEKRDVSPPLSIFLFTADTAGGRREEMWIERGGLGKRKALPANKALLSLFISGCAAARLLDLCQFSFSRRTPAQAL
jgi:hypothetical protein